jgi:hypothetical protein
MYFDLLFTNVFRIEGFYVVCVSIILGIKTLDNLPIKLKINHTALGLLDFILIGFLLLSFWTLFITSGAFIYAEGKLPLIWIATLIACSLLFFQSVRDISKIMKEKN